LELLAVSIHLVSLAFAADLKGSAQSVLLSYAHHADASGVSYPSIERVAWETGLSRRQAQRVVKGLVKSDVLEPLGATCGGRGHTTRYAVRPERAPQKLDFSPKGDTQSVPPGEAPSTKGDISAAPERMGDMQASSLPSGKGDIQVSHMAATEPERVTFSTGKGDIQVSPERRNGTTSLSADAVVLSTISEGGGGEKGDAIEAMKTRANAWILDQLPPPGDPQRRTLQSRLKSQLEPIVLGEDRTGWSATPTGEPIPWADRPAVFGVMLGVLASKQRDSAHAALILAVQQQKDPLPVRRSGVTPGTEAARILAHGRDPVPGASRALHRSTSSPALLDAIDLVPEPIRGRLRASALESVGEGATREEVRKKENYLAAEWQRHHNRPAAVG
jgi:hypothetical protein